jgi:hypothetical protein
VLSARLPALHRVCVRVCSQERNTVDARATSLLGMVRLGRNQLEDFVHERLTPDAQVRQASPHTRHTPGRARVVLVPQHTQAAACAKARTEALSLRVS